MLTMMFNVEVDLIQSHNNIYRVMLFRTEAGQVFSLWLRGG